MVDFAWIAVLAEAQDKAEPLLMRLDPQNRAKVLMAVFGLAILGIALVAFIWAAGRHARRLAAKSFGPTRRGEDDWYRKPLVPPDPPGSSRE